MGFVALVVGMALALTWLMPSPHALPLPLWSLLAGGAGMALGIWLIGMGTRVGQWARRMDRWIIDHATAIEGDGAWWGEYRIGRGTELCQFEAAVSYILGTLTPRTPLILAEAQAGRARLASLLCLLVTLVAGWWSFPFGPVTTVRVLWVNVHGGHRTTVGQRLDELRGHPPRLPWITPRAADHALATMELKRYPPSAALYIGPNRDPDHPLSLTFSPDTAHDDCWLFTAHDLPILLHHDVSDIAADFIIDLDPAYDQLTVKPRPRRI